MPWTEFTRHVNGLLLKHDPYPMYLGVTLDRTLSYRVHLSRAVKLKSRNNLIAKLSGTSWGASSDILRTSALTLCYSVAEYCCPVWARSSYTNLIGTQLHSALHLISGYLQPTQLLCQPMLHLLCVVKQQLTVCFKSSKSVQTGLCMLMSLSIHLHGLHLDAQYDIYQHCYTVERGLVVSFYDQAHYCYGPYYPAARFWPPSSYMVSDELFPDRSRPMSC